MLTRYEKKDKVYPLFGRSKIAVMTENHNRHMVEDRERFMKAVGNLTQMSTRHEKEGDWAIMGGIAQGIGGVGAGIAAAAETERKNAEIRARNAQRDIERAKLNALAANYGKTPVPKISNLAGEWKVSIDESTETLFSRLRITRPKDRETHIDFRIPADADYFIDGYIRVTRKSNGKVMGEEILPLPLWQKDQKEQCVSAWKETMEETYSPVALWKIAKGEKAGYFPADSLDDIPDSPDKKRLKEEWDSAYAAHEELVRSVRKRFRQNRLKLLAIVAAVLAVLIGGGILIWNKVMNDGAFSRVKSYYESGWVNGYMLQEMKTLPASYNGRLAEAALNAAQKSYDEGMDEVARGFEKSSYALQFSNVCQILDSIESRIAPGSDQERAARKLRIQSLVMQEKATAAEITEAFRQDVITEQDVVDLASVMARSESGKVVQEAVSALSEIAASYAPAAELLEQASGLREEYAKAVAMFDAYDFAGCAEWFREHHSYEHSGSYAALAIAAGELSGTWRSGSHTAEISVDTGRKVYWSSGSPWRMYLRLTVDGTDYEEYGILGDYNGYRPSFDYRISREGNGLPLVFKINRKADETMTLTITLRKPGSKNKMVEVWQEEFHKD